MPTSSCSSVGSRVAKSFWIAVPEAWIARPSGESGWRSA